MRLVEINQTANLSIVVTIHTEFQGWNTSKHPSTGDFSGSVTKLAGSVEKFIVFLWKLVKVSLHFFRSVRPS
jgi:hypothetical protein